MPKSKMLLLVALAIVALAVLLDVGWLRTGEISVGGLIAVSLVAFFAAHLVE